MPTDSPNAPELLAPAGGPAALRAAIANGADAVYLGVELFNARRSAENFTLDSLGEVCSFAHLRGRRVYLTVNVVVLPDEMAQALALVDRAWASGVDAVIVQDLGLLRSIRLQLPHVRIHASTQINAHNLATVETLGELGVSRVTLAREVSIEEIERLAESSVEIETFVHGALCVCYSGQCLMSSLIGRRSANRGMCAQPCRLPYELLVDGTVLAEPPGAHLLSPKDLAGITLLGRLVSTGVSALKIEGRMKSPEYVALVTRTYRVALDRAVAAPSEYAVTEGELSVLAESFSRGFTEAYLLKERGNDMMSYRRPNNRGVLVGRVTHVDGSEVTVSLEASLEAEDTLEFWTGSGRFAQPAGALRVEGAARRNAPAGAKVAITVGEPVGPGDRVFRVRNSALSEAAARTFSDPDAVAPIELDFAVTALDGRPLRVDVTDGAGRRGSAEASPVERARTKPITAEEIAEHIGRLGGTPYRIGRFELELSTGVGLSFSQLHRVRRQAIAHYESKVLDAWTVRAPATARAAAPMPAPWLCTSGIPQVVASVADEHAAVECLAAGADMACVPVGALAAPRDLPKGVVALLPRICHEGEVRSALAWAAAGRRVVVGNLGLLREAGRQGAVVEADWALNALNPQAVAQLAELGASFVWLSPELSGRQIAQVIAGSPLPTGIAVLGRQELMVTEHCVLMAEGQCERGCALCSRRGRGTNLRDRKGYEFPVMTDTVGRSHIYNSVPLDLLTALPEIVAAGVSAVRVDAALENAHGAARFVSQLRQALERVNLGVEAAEPDRSSATTSGHYFRGVL